MKVGEYDNQELSPITDQIDYLIQPGSRTTSLTGFHNFMVCTMMMMKICKICRFLTSNSAF